MRYVEQIARILFAALCLGVVAVSRGTRPDTAVPQVVRGGLAGDGFDVARFQPRAFSASDLASAILVVTLDADIGAIAEPSARISHWDGLTPRGARRSSSASAR